MRACANCACGCANVAKVGVLCVVVCMSALFVRLTGVHAHDHALLLESYQNVVMVGVLCVVVCVTALFVRLTGVHAHDHALLLESYHLSFQLSYNCWYEQ